MASLNNSTAYQRYLALPGLPRNCPDFDRNLNNEVIVNLHERKCRLKVLGVPCPAFVGTAGALVQHIELRHHLTCAGRGEARRPSTAKILAANAFYEDLMTEHDRVVAEETTAVRERARIQNLQVGNVKLPAIKILDGEDRGDNDLSKMNRLLAIMGKRTPCDTCVLNYDEDIVECKLDFEVNGEGKRVPGGAHCENTR
ncbi:hypothetical protein BU23DRAFT_604922, partial [Bimuria novae-zelandiae CBS 107.79]